MTTYKNYTDKDTTDRKRVNFNMRPNMIYFIKYQTRSLNIVRLEFHSFIEYCDKLEQLRNKATNILDYGAIGE